MPTDNKKKSIGKILSEARKRSNLSIQEIAKITKINTQYLEHLENDNFDLMPSHVYTKSYITTYAKYLGLDHQELIKLYKNRKNKIIPKRNKNNPNTKAQKPYNKIFILISLIILATVIYLINQENLKKSDHLRSLEEQSMEAKIIKNINKAKYLVEIHGVEETSIFFLRNDGSIESTRNIEKGESYNFELTENYSPNIVFKNKDDVKIIFNEKEFKNLKKLDDKFGGKVFYINKILAHKENNIDEDIDKIKDGFSVVSKEKVNFNKFPWQNLVLKKYPVQQVYVEFSDEEEQILHLLGVSSVHSFKSESTNMLFFIMRMKDQNFQSDNVKEEVNRFFITRPYLYHAIVVENQNYLFVIGFPTKEHKSLELEWIQQDFIRSFSKPPSYIDHK